MARNIGYNFNGKRIVKPGAHSRIDASALGMHNSNAEKKIVFLGSAQGGEPRVYQEFSNYSEAKAVLRGGDLLTAGELAWTPSGDSFGAGNIGFIRVEDATKASLTKDGLKLSSYFYGTEANDIQVKLEEGTYAGSKRLTLYFWKENIREVYDNLGPVFNIKYEGTEEYASATITTDAGGKASKLVLKAGADKATAVEVASYPLGDGSEFAEVNKLVNDINERPDFSSAQVSVPTISKVMRTAELDEITDVSVIETQTVTALKGDILYNIETYSSLVKAEFTSDAVPADFGYENLTGGTNGTVPASWVDYLDLVIGEGAYIIVPLTADEAVHAEVQRFVEYRSHQENDEMRAFYGGGLKETVDQVIKRASTINSTRGTVVYPGITRKVANGGTKTLPAYFSAAIVAGRISGIPVGEPATFDYLNLIGVEKVLTSSEIDKLLENGVTPIEYVRSKNRNGYRIAQSITTYQEDNNPAFRENSISEIMDFLNMEMREYLESRFVGTKATAATPSLIKNAVQSFLDEKVREEWLVEYDPESVTVMDGEVIRVGYSAMPVFAINYIFITGTFYRSILTA